MAFLLQVGFRDERLVDRALDTEFGRAENVIFVGVRCMEPILQRMGGR